MVIVAFVLLIWFIADLRYDRQWSRKRAELGAQSRWKVLNRHFEAHLACRRPLLRLFRAWVGPGLLEADHAIHLSNQGDHEQALQWAERAVNKSARRLLGLVAADGVDTWMCADARARLNSSSGDPNTN